MRHYSRKKRKSEGIFERNKGDIATKYLGHHSKKSIGLKKLIDQKAFEVVQNKLKLNRKNKSHRTSPINNIKLDLNWVPKSPQASREEAERSKFFLSRAEKKARPAHRKSGGVDESSQYKQESLKVIAESKANRGARVKKLVLDSQQKEGIVESKESAGDKEKTTFNSVNFLSSRIQKEYYMSLEIKRLNKKFKEQKEKD